MPADSSVRAAVEHDAYERALRSLGATVVRAAPAPDHPDSVFVEDTAIVLDEVAVITRPGAASRQAETAGVVKALSPYRSLVHMTAPATLDGGDVLRVGRTLYIGRSSRTNAAGIEQLAQLVGEWDYQVVSLDVTGCLHLKSAVTQVAHGVLLANTAWVPAGAFVPLDMLDVDPAEPAAANALRIGDAVVFPEHHPRTARRLEQAGIRLIPVPAGELAKAEGGVTCCSLIVES